MSRWIDGEWLLNFFEPYPNDYQTPLGSLRACVDDAPTIKTKQIKYYDEDEKVWKTGEVIISDSEKPNNCEHITEDGVTCAKYPACDDCLDNPLNKVKGSERLVKGSEQTDCAVITDTSYQVLDGWQTREKPKTTDCPWK